MNRRVSPPRRVAGLSLVELMISLVLGLMIVGAALTVFISNRQTYIVNETLGRLQETARIGFEIMTRDVREAGGTPCDLAVPVVNVLTTPANNWWSDWTLPMRGFDGGAAFPTGTIGAFGTAAGTRLAGTDAFEIRSATSNGLTVANHQPMTRVITLNKVDHGLQTGDIAMVCDFERAAIFQITSASSGTTNTITHATTAGFTPGNARGCLMPLEADCSAAAAPVVTYSYGCFDGRRTTAGVCSDARPWPGIIAELEAYRWFVGTNARGGTSLFRTGLRNMAGTPSDELIEVAENVSDMQVSYLVGGTTYVDASAVANWLNVSGVRVRLTLSGIGPSGTDGEPLQRQIQHTIAMRNTP